MKVHFQHVNLFTQERTDRTTCGRPIHFSNDLGNHQFARAITLDRAEVTCLPCRRIIYPAK